LHTSSMPTIVFEPDVAGGGSFWDGDDLLAVLTVMKHPNRRGQLSLRSTNRAFNTFTMTRHSNKRRNSYRLVEGLRRLADAQRIADKPSVTLRYRGQEYTATSESLFSARGDQQIAVLAPPLNWHARQMTLGVGPDVDLPLVAFYLFVAYDLSNVQSTGAGIAL
jgi:hypothetical protein